MQAPWLTGYTKLMKYSPQSKTAGVATPPFLL
jgi:hypothetical protein